jgi:hypothetical protein
MTDEEIHKLSVEIRNALIPPRCVSTEIPAEVQAVLKEYTYGRPYEYRMPLPMGAHGILVNFSVLTNGTLKLELLEMNGNPFWRVYLGAEDAK